jgi:hypothetical protein
MATTAQETSIDNGSNHAKEIALEESKKNCASYPIEYLGEERGSRVDEALMAVD